jgi:hypothetical protein
MAAFSFEGSVEGGFGLISDIGGDLGYSRF